MAMMIAPEDANDTCMGFNRFHMTKSLYIRFLPMKSSPLWWLGKLICCVYKFHVSIASVLTTQ